MSKAEVIARIISGGVIPVIRASSQEEALAVVAAIAAGGVTTIEVTMTVPDAIDTIAKLSRLDDLLIGAGSVLDPETARECFNAGAEFIVSPATNFDTIQYCNESDIVVMPGALTPTEIVNAWDAPSETTIAPLGVIEPLAPAEAVMVCGASSPIWKSLNELMPVACVLVAVRVPVPVENQFGEL